MTKFVITCESQEDFDYYYFGPKMHRVLWDHLQLLRSKIKYEELSETEYEIYSKLREGLFNALNEEDISQLF